MEFLAGCGGIVVDPPAGRHEINKLLPVPGQEHENAYLVQQVSVGIAYQNDRANGDIRHSCHLPKLKAKVKWRGSPDR